MTRRVKPRLAPEAISVTLKAVYDAVAAEPVPKCFHDLIRAMK